MPVFNRNQAARIKKRTWFFLDAVVEVEPGHFHRAGFGRFLLPHPPVVNWLLRRGLARDAYKKLCSEHEMGHLQALPFEALYSVILVLVMIHNETNDVIGWLWVVASSFAAWEILAEIHTIRHVQSGYQCLYRDISLIPRSIFWGIALFLVLGGWVYVFRHTFIQ
ncbi:MAG TPA: hypothetical protein ENK04_11810 [Gammaproteobacteria bacterium]|nr:hypothetical protein [Gammaproteobacteria bacterium]